MTDNESEKLSLTIKCTNSSLSAKEAAFKVWAVNSERQNQRKENINFVTMDGKCDRVIRTRIEKYAFQLFSTIIKIKEVAMSYMVSSE